MIEQLDWLATSLGELLHYCTTIGRGWPLCRLKGCPEIDGYRVATGSDQRFWLTESEGLFWWLDRILSTTIATCW